MSRMSTSAERNQQVKLCAGFWHSTGADQGQSQAAAGEELLGALSGRALVRDDGGAGRGTVRGLAFQGLPGLVPLAVQLGVGEAEPGDGPVAGADDQQL